MTRLPQRLAATGGLVGPAAFVAAWVASGAATPGYRPTEDPISRLAAVGAPTRPGMTAGLLTFALGVGGYAMAARTQMSRSVALAAGGTALGSAAIAALPLDGPHGDGPHALAAGAAYVTLAMAPLVGSAVYAARGQRRAAGASRIAGVLTGMALAASVVAPGGHGLLQRVGLTIGDAWIAATAVGMLRRSAGSSPSAPVHEDVDEDPLAVG